MGNPLVSLPLFIPRNIFSHNFPLDLLSVLLSFFFTLILIYIVLRGPFLFYLYPILSIEDSAAGTRGSNPLMEGVDFNSRMQVWTPQLTDRRTTTDMTPHSYINSVLQWTANRNRM